MGTSESEGIMGYAEIHTVDGWVDVQDLIDIAESQGLLVRLDTNRWQVLE